MAITLRSRTLQRAVEILGGMDESARKLGVPPSRLRCYVNGDVPVPPSLFARAIEILSDAGVEALRNPTPPPGAGATSAPKRRTP